LLRCRGADDLRHQDDLVGGHTTYPPETTNANIVVGVTVVDGGTTFVVRLSARASSWRAPTGLPGGGDNAIAFASPKMLAETTTHQSMSTHFPEGGRDASLDWAAADLGQDCFN
jgi:hypothetical protein